MTAYSDSEFTCTQGNNAIQKYILHTYFKKDMQKNLKAYDFGCIHTQVHKYTHMHTRRCTQHTTTYNGTVVHTSSLPDVLSSAHTILKHP